MLRVISFSLIANSLACMVTFVIAMVQSNVARPLTLLPDKKTAWICFMLPLGTQLLFGLFLGILRLEPLRPGWLRPERLTEEKRRSAYQRLKRLMLFLKYSLLICVPLAYVLKWCGVSGNVPGELNPLGLAVGFIVVMGLLLLPWILLYGTLYNVDPSFLDDASSRDSLD